MKLKKVTPRNIERLAKGIMSNFATIVGISQFLPDRERERIERMSERESDRAERMRDKNNRRLQNK